MFTGKEKSSGIIFFFIIIILFLSGFRDEINIRVDVSIGKEASGYPNIV